MIVSKLSGGLGNQLFQYSFGRYLANKQGTKLLLDISFYRNQNKRKYMLDAFNIDAEVTIKVFNLIEFKEHNFAFDYKYKEISDNSIINGYWQSERYFEEIAQSIRDELTIRGKMTNAANKIIEQIKTRSSVSIHIRRGDYITEKKTNLFHGVCDLDYYNNAIDYINSICDLPDAYIFSDDIEWCKNNINIKNKIFFVNDDRKISDCEELIIMSNCENNIISNSTFSWWSAWLNDKKNKIVISPKKWFLDENINTVDLIPQNWIKI